MTIEINASSPCPLTDYGVAAFTRQSIKWFTSLNARFVGEQSTDIAMAAPGWRESDCLQRTKWSFSRGCKG